MIHLWFAKSEEDLRVAQTLISLKTEHFESVVFHCQQAVEKALKGYLAFHKIRFPKTHDIEKLVCLIPPTDSLLASELTKTTVLTKYAVAYRYPEEIEAPQILTKNIVENLCQISQDAYEVLKAKTQQRPSNA